MPLQEIYYIAEMVVGVAVIISIVFVAVELRQNTYITRKSMADQRKQRLNWTWGTVVTDSDFRDFHRRIDTEWNNFNEDERHRGIALGIMAMRSILDELVAYFDGQISPEEYENLKWNMRVAKGRPHNLAAYEILKDAFPVRVQKHWEASGTLEHTLARATN